MPAETLPDLSERAELAVRRLEHAADFFGRKCFEDLLEDRLSAAVVAVASTWLDRKTAGAYCHCSVSEIDRAANAGTFKRYWRGETPVFRRQEIDQAIESGLWRKTKGANHAEQTE